MLSGTAVKKASIIDALLNGNYDCHASGAAVNLHGARTPPPRFAKAPELAAKRCPIHHKRNSDTDHAKMRSSIRDLQGRGE